MLSSSRTANLRVPLVRPTKTKTGKFEPNVRATWYKDQLALGGLPPPSPPPASQELLNVLGPRLIGAMTKGNKETPAKVVFYSFGKSNAQLRLVEDLFNNRAGHLVPCRFILDVRHRIPSAEEFQDLLYDSGLSSCRIFLNPHPAPGTRRTSRVQDHIPNAAHLHSIATKNPEYMLSPIVHLLQYDKRPQVLIGPKAGIETTLILSRRRAEKLGQENDSLLKKWAAGMRETPR
ncbi:hypothetical protein FB45DRAFT_918758 [Roridomyces roridus]|uniref:Uncharacterized protein n=1 Tax=Roridomyces roridus TaxID=1738132 RepID=A0AAD7FME3_9AGAR|nr:hypothetical protein FB45DRAFT_918758 [Roridomyces roridus]